MWTIMYFLISAGGCFLCSEGRVDISSVITDYTESEDKYRLDNTIINSQDGLSALTVS